MKSYTDITQSKKLAEILPVESTDMYYYTVNGDWEWYETPNVIERRDDLEEHAMPAWSLAALLDQLDDVIYDEEGYTYQLQIIKEGVQYYLIYEGADDFASYETSLYDDLIDAVVEMIIMLKEKNLL